MTRQKAFISIQKELLHINRQIDENIIKGIPYKNEAMRHRVLKMQLERIRKSRKIPFSFLSFSFR